MNFKKKEKRYTSYTRNTEAWLPYSYQKPLLTSLLLMSSWPPSDWSIKITHCHAIGPGVSQIEVSLPYLHTNAGLPRCDAKLDESFLVPRLQFLSCIPQEDVILFLGIVIFMSLRPVVAGSIGKYVPIVIEATSCYWLI